MSFIFMGREYTFDHMLGQGGSAAVCLVHNVEGEYYAVKFSTSYPQEMIQDMKADGPNYQGPWTSTDRISEEVTVLRELQQYLNDVGTTEGSASKRKITNCHPNLACYFLSGTIANDLLPVEMQNPYGEAVSMIFESYVDGPTIRDIMDGVTVASLSAPLTVIDPELKRIRVTSNNNISNDNDNDKLKLDYFKLTVDLLSALSTLESADIVYLDLSEYNVLYDAPSNNYVIVDFNDVAGDNPRQTKQQRSAKQADALARFLYFVLHQQYYPYETSQLVSLANNADDDAKSVEQFIQQVINNKLTLTEAIVAYSQLYPTRDINIRLKSTNDVYRNGVKQASLSAIKAGNKSASYWVNFKPASTYPIDVVGNTVNMYFGNHESESKSESESRSTSLNNIPYLSYDSHRLKIRYLRDTYNTILGILQSQTVTAPDVIKSLPHPSQTLQKLKDKGTRLSDNNSKPEPLFIIEQALDKFLSPQDGNEKQLAAAVLASYGILKRAPPNIGFVNLLNQLGIRSYPWSLYNQIESLIAA